MKGLSFDFFVAVVMGSASSTALRFMFVTAFLGSVARTAEVDMFFEIRNSGKKD